MSPETRTAPRICPLCEATCGLTLTIEGTRVTGARGDRDDIFSRGFVCPKGAAFGELDSDPDRLAGPLVRRTAPEGTYDESDVTYDENGVAYDESSWDAAFDLIAARIRPIVEEHGPHAVGIVLGNPTVHAMAGMLYPPVLLAALGTRSFFTSSTLDQMPKHVSSGLLFGDPDAFPVPDLDRTDHLLLIGANPLASNGSLCTAPDFPGRLKALRRRGGTLTVIDPRRTRTAELADRHVAIRPGTDALLLAALAQVLFAEGLADPGALAPHLEGLAELRGALAEFTPESVADACDVPADTIRALARELAAAPTAAVYGRLGASTVEFGTLASWLVDVLNVLTGNLDRPGGALFPLSATAEEPRPGPDRRTPVCPAAPGTHARGVAEPPTWLRHEGAPAPCDRTHQTPPGRPAGDDASPAIGPGPGKGFRLGRWHSRVSGHPEAKSELPIAALAEEIETPGEGRIRALIAIGANPVLSGPDGLRLEKALGQLEFMVSVDPYLNETARHAHVVLPPPPPSQSPHFDFAFNTVAVHNQVRYTPPAVPLQDGRISESEILARLILAASGMHGAPPAAVDDLVVGQLLGKAVAAPHSRVHGRDPEELAAQLTGADGAHRRLDLMLRLGPYGEAFGADPEGLTLQRLLAHPHGIDLGPLQSRVPGLLKTRSGRIELLPEPLAADLHRLAAARERDTGAALLLIGRRHLRSNNSWLHNLPALNRGSNRCTLQIHPEDAARLGVTDGGPVRIKGAGGEIEAPAEVTDAVRTGVVSLPHGWGHDRPGTRTSVAAARPGVNSNQVLDGTLMDPVSGTSVLNGVPVLIEPASVPVSSSLS